jgi:hypothetical protein
MSLRKGLLFAIVASAETRKTLANNGLNPSHAVCNEWRTISIQSVTTSATDQFSGL